jgi:hypothetical protein
MFTGAIGVVGTGAFSAVEADRTASVNVASDANALLGLEAVDKHKEYVETTNGTIGINVEGANKNAVTVIDPLIKVTNNGTARITVGFDSDIARNQDATYDDKSAGYPTGWTYAGGSNAYVILWGPYDDDDDYEKITNENLSNATGFDGTGLVDDRYSYEYELKGEREIEPGESLKIGCTVDTEDQSLGGQSPSDLDDTFTVLAEQV